MTLNEELTEDYLEYLNEKRIEEEFIMKRLEKDYMKDLEKEYLKETYPEE